MKIGAIKKLAEQYSSAQLHAAAEAIEAEQAPAIEIPGEDEGDQLTNALAAAWIKDKMETEGLDLRTALRQYSQRVRDSIG